MKKILYALLAASIAFTSCRKQQATQPGSNTSQVTEADFKDGKAVLAVTGAMKKNDDGLELDYDLIIKEVSDHNYVAAVKLHGLTLQGKKLTNFKNSLRGVVIAINNTKGSEDEPELSVVLDATETSGNIYATKPFRRIEDLAYETVNVGAFYTVTVEHTVMPDNPVFTPAVAVHDNILALTVTNNNTVIPANSAVLFGKESIVSGVTIKSNIKEGTATISDEITAFVFPSGLTAEQNPEVTKAVIKKSSKDAFGYAIVTVAGDPAGLVENVLYAPKPVSANNPKDPKAVIELPVMKFEPTHINKTNGVIRFKSTQTWSEVYGKTPISDPATATFGISSVSILVRK